MKELLDRIRDSRKVQPGDEYHHGNIKLGEVYSFSLLALVTCFVKTAHCAGRCYAKRMQRRRDTIWYAWARNTQISLRPDFGKLMTIVLSRLDPGVFRIHVGGEFHSTRYIRGWLDALAANPHIKPFAFTRAWRYQRFLKAFGYPDRWPAWLMGSTDPETGPLPPGIREAKMAETRLHGEGDMPRGLCDEQRDPERSCDKCGRCPLWKLVDGKLVKLPEAAARVGVTFAEH